MGQWRGCVISPVLTKFVPSIIVLGQYVNERKSPPSHRVIESPTHQVTESPSHQVDTRPVRMALKYTYIYLFPCTSCWPEYSGENGTTLIFQALNETGSVTRTKCLSLAVLPLVYFNCHSARVEVRVSYLIVLQHM
jgi:hypothetical protein